MERQRYRAGSTLIYNRSVASLRNTAFAMGICLTATTVWSGRAAEQQPQQPPPPSAGRILLVPRRAAAGERVTLAVLDAGGRLTPGVTVRLSTGARVTTDSTGRATFLAPAESGSVIASIRGRRSRAAIAILPAATAGGAPLAVRVAPRFAALSDRFEVAGSGFCGEADANRVSIAGRPALVLAASSLALTILPPEELDPGPAEVALSCRDRAAVPFPLTFVSLELQASAAPLAPGERRELLVRVTGTNARVPLEARNLAPKIAELAGGNPMRVSSTGGSGNSARFELVGRTRGSFLIRFGLGPSSASPHP
jgi:hypothetical protein